MADVNRQLAAVFEDMTRLGEILGIDRFKAISFGRAARVLEDLPRDVSTLSEKELIAVDGIGKGTATRIREFLDTGRIADHDEMLEQVPTGVVKLLRVQGLGPKTVSLLWKQGGIESPEQLLKQIEAGGEELKKIRGLGDKKLQQIAEGLHFIESVRGRVRLGTAMPLAEILVGRVRELPGVQRADYAGSLRRGRETIGDLDILAAAEATDAAQITKKFAELPGVTRVLTRGEHKASVMMGEEEAGDEGGVQVDLRVVEPGQYGAGMMYFTGSKDHNIQLRERAIGQGMKLSEHGLTRGDKLVTGDTEEAVYRALGLAWIPPELREAQGEIAMAEGDPPRLPELIQLGDVKAELHAHTDASDGSWSIRELALAAAERGYHTLAVTDHSKSSIQANGLSPERLEKHIAHIREVAGELKDTIRILAGSEVDILADGRLDYDDSLLAQLDLVVASPHAPLRQSAKDATKRLIRAIENPYVTILGHATGRIINSREGLTPDMDAVCRAAADRGIALEINANHYRLDLRDTHARLALSHGCQLAINTDAHGGADLDQLRFGVLTARRAGATKADVVNCLTQKQLAKWIESTRSA